MKFRIFSLFMALFSAVMMLFSLLLMKNVSGELLMLMFGVVLYWALFAVLFFVAYLVITTMRWRIERSNAGRKTSCLTTLRYNSSSDEIADWNDEKFAYINRSIAIHEAGHIVVARAVNIPITSVSVSFSGGSNCVFTSCPAVCFAEDLYKQILLFYSGIAAEQVLCGCISSSNISAPSMVQNEENSVSDFDRAKDFLLSYVRTTSFPDILSAEQEHNLVNEFSRKFFDKAVKIVELHKEEVEAIAAELMELGEDT